MSKCWTKSTCLDSANTASLVLIPNDGKSYRFTVIDMIKESKSIFDTVQNSTMQLADVSKTGVDEILTIYDLIFSFELIEKYMITAK